MTIDVDIHQRFRSSTAKRLFKVPGVIPRLPLPPGGVGQGLGDVLGFQVGILAENLVPRPSCGNEADDRPDRDTRMPRMHGFPPITAGSRVMRVSCGMSCDLGS
jgi:hypothetical protein